MDTESNPFYNKLRSAIREGDLSEVEAILRVSEGTVMLRDHADRTLGHLCARYGRATIFRRLLEEGLPVSAVDREGVAPLEVACRNGEPDFVKLILTAGSDPNVGRPAVSAVNRRDEHTVPILRLLIEHGLDVNQSFVMFGDESKRRTVLDFAGDGPAADFLRTHGAKTQAELDAAAP